MKKICLTGIFVFAFFILFSPVFAVTQNATTSAKAQILQNKNEKRIELKEEAKIKIRTSVGKRVAVYSKAIQRTSALIEKLDNKIARAEQNGKNMTEAKALQADSKIKLEDAKMRLTEIESKKGTGVDKETFLAIKDDFKVIWQDLHQIKLNSARVISILKSFNSTESTKSATISGEIKVIKIKN